MYKQVLALILVFVMLVGGVSAQDKTPEPPHQVTVGEILNLKGANVCMPLLLAERTSAALIVAKEMLIAMSNPDAFLVDYLKNQQIDLKSIQGDVYMNIRLRIATAACYFAQNVVITVVTP